VNQNTFEDLVMTKLKLKGKIYNKDEKLRDLMEEKDENKMKLKLNSSKVKGTLIYKQIIDRYITLVEGSELDIKNIMVQDQVLFEKKEIMRLYLKDLRSYPINKRKDEIKRYLNLKIKERTAQVLFNIDLEYDKTIKVIKSEAEDSLERRETLIKIYDERDKIKDKIRLSVKKEFNNYFKDWRDVGSKDILHNFFNDKKLFDIATDGKIPVALSEYMKEEYNYNYDNGIIDEDDLASFAYIRILLEGIEEKERFKHIVVDEAQDYSPFQIYIINNFTKGNSLTLVGDLAQGIYYYKGIKKWEDITEGLFNGEATYIELTQSYRSTVEIIDFAAKTLEAQKLGLKESKPVLRHGENPEIINLESESELASAIIKIIKTVREKGKNSIAIITKDREEAKDLAKKLSKNSEYSFELISGKEKNIKSEQIIIPSYLTKGLEFDCTIILDPTEDKYSCNVLDERLLYVALTRALHFEYVLKFGQLTSLI
jgi:DNA helicase-2/ATP-dependent DNA helicase PcrA